MTAAMMTSRLCGGCYAVEYAAQIAATIRMRAQLNAQEFRILRHPLTTSLEPIGFPFLRPRTERGRPESIHSQIHLLLETRSQGCDF